MPVFAAGPADDSPPEALVAAGHLALTPSPERLLSDQGRQNPGISSSLISKQAETAGADNKRALTRLATRLCCATIHSCAAVQSAASAQKAQAVGPVHIFFQEDFLQQPLV